MNLICVTKRIARGMIRVVERPASWVRPTSRIDLYCECGLHCESYLCHGMTCIVDATSILLKTTLECGLFCVKDIE